MESLINDDREGLEVERDKEEEDREEEVEIHLKVDGEERFSEPVPREIRNTLLLSAAQRARECTRKRPIFRDPWAAYLAADEGINILEHFENGIQDSMWTPATVARELANTASIIRTRSFDDFIATNLKEHQMKLDIQRQVVLLACGLDTRAYRLRWPKRVLLYELDTKEVLEYKNRKLKELKDPPKIRCGRRTCVPTDLIHDNWISKLEQHNWRSTVPTTWICEDYLGYLEHNDAMQLLKTISGASMHPASGLACDFGNPRLSVPALTRDGTNYDRIPTNKFGVHNPENMLREIGWKNPVVYQFGDKPINYGDRWPSIPISRWVPFLPRNWLTFSRNSYWPLVLGTMRKYFRDEITLYN